MCLCVCKFLLRKCLRYNNRKIYSLYLFDNKLHKESYFNYFESAIAESNFILDSLVVLDFEFFQYIYELNIVFITFLKKFMLCGHVGQTKKQND